MSVKHESFFSRMYGMEVGYNVYLPDDYESSDEKYPVVYHLHGWQCDQNTDVGTLSGICRGRRAITVFACNSADLDGREDLPVEEMVIEELVPHIDGRFRTVASREGRALSGFSMGGGMAFAYAVRHTDVFSAVTAYAGTYHHSLPPEVETVGVDASRAGEIYRRIMDEKLFGPGRYYPHNVIALVMQHRDDMREKLDISIHVGMDDILYCENEIMHMHLDALGIKHEYVRYEGAGHSLCNII